MKFQGQTGWQIDDLNPIEVRLLGWSQLSNPLDLPCCNNISYSQEVYSWTLYLTLWRLSRIWKHTNRLLLWHGLWYINIYHVSLCVRHADQGSEIEVNVETKLYTLRKPLFPSSFVVWCGRLLSNATGLCIFTISRSDIIDGRLCNRSQFWQNI